MRTQQEILDRMQAPTDDIFGFEREVLIEALDFEHAAPFLANTDAEPWTFLSDDAAIMKALADYLHFAWGKAENHRGNSASRSVDKLTAYSWLLGREDVVAAIEKAPYENYGCPKLAVIARAFDLPIPTSPAVTNMIAGAPCGADYECGCGRGFTTTMITVGD